MFIAAATRRKFLLGFLLLGSLSSWLLLDRQEFDWQPGVELPQALPDSYIQDFDLKFLQGDEGVKYRLFADRWTYFDDRQLSELKKPRLKIVMASGAYWEIYAQTAQMLDNGRQVHFEQDVIIRRVAVNVAEGLEITTEYLDVWPINETMKTAAAVSIKHFNGLTLGRGMEADFSMQRVTLLNDVFGEYEIAASN